MGFVQADGVENTTKTNEPTLVERLIEWRRNRDDVDRPFDCWDEYFDKRWDG